MMYIPTKSDLSRRNLIKRTALGSSLPLLAPLFSVAQSNDIPKRFVFVVEGNGINPGNFLSSASRDALNNAGANIQAGDRVINRSYGHDQTLNIQSAGLSDALALSSLAPDGQASLLDYSRVVLGLSSKVSGGGHTSNYGALSCASSRPRVPSLATIDHVLGGIPAIRSGTPFDVVRLGIHPESNLNYNTCASGENAPAPIICDSKTAYYSLFGSVAPGNGRQSFLDRRSLLDFIHADVTAALAIFSGSSDERTKLEKYLESVEGLTQRHDSIKNMEGALQAVAPDGPGATPAYSSSHHLQHLEIMFDLSTAALIGGLTNVVVLASGTGERGYNIDYTDMGFENVSRHGLCHAYELEALTRITERHVNMISKMARRLLEVPENGGTMLDNTLIIYLSDNGEKHHSNAEEWPLLLVGGNNMGLGLGNRSIVYPGFGNDNNRQLSNFFSTLLHISGSPQNEFGYDPNRIALGPLGEIWQDV